MVLLAFLHRAYRIHRVAVFVLSSSSLPYIADSILLSVRPMRLLLPRSLVLLAPLTSHNTPPWTSHKKHGKLSNRRKNWVSQVRQIGGFQDLLGGACLGSDLCDKKRVLRMADIGGASVSLQLCGAISQ